MTGKSTLRRILRPLTYNNNLKKGIEILKNAGITECDRDAELLLMHATGKDKTFLLTYGDSEEMDPGDEGEYLAMIVRRAERIPLQLITGETDFMGLTFKVSEDVLIPRIDTDFLVEEALIDINDGADVLDMCTGSGCILLSVMKYKNDIHGVGADISGSALDLARENAASLKLSNAEFIESDLFSCVRGKFDFILCNPPYIRSREIEGLMEEVKMHEPLAALDGGEDGLLFYRRMASEAWDHLNGGGEMIFEIGYDQGEDVADILKMKGYSNIKILKDYSGNERVVKCLKS